MKIVHVAGTKGKGSTSAMIAAALTAAGNRTGLYTSPHLERIEERIAIDGTPCSGAELVGLVERLQPEVEALDKIERSVGDVGPTYFEIITAMAILHFAERQVEAVVLEVGLGGRLDATNVCLPMVSVITNISRDHTKQLGDTLAEIAGEKAGIIKPGVPVVSGVTASEPRQVIQAVAHQHGCRLMELGEQFRFRDVAPNHWVLPLDRRPACNTLDFFGTVAGEEKVLNSVQLGLVGHHQAANAAVALATLFELQHQGWKISEQAIRGGLGNVRMPARVEVFPGKPTVIVDTAHNEASAAALVETIEQHAPRPRLLVLSISRDKEVREIVQILVPHFDRFVVTQYVENPRAVPVEALRTLVCEELLADGREEAPVAMCVDPAEAWECVQCTAAANELVCISGSFFLAAEMRRYASPRSFS